MSDTKTIIVAKAVELFNIHGYKNVSLQQIADALKLSTGNLTYHFKKKDQLLEAIYNHFQVEIDKVTPRMDTFADIQGIDQQVRQFYRFQQRFQFFYLDLLEIERSYPTIAKQHHVHIENQINRLHNILIYNVGKGNIKSEEQHLYLRPLAEQIWFSVVFWLTQMKVRGLHGQESDMVDMHRLLIRPHLTDQGLEMLDALEPSKNASVSSLGV